MRDHSKTVAPTPGAELDGPHRVRTGQVLPPDSPQTTCSDEACAKADLLARARVRTAWDFADEIEGRWQKNQSCSRRLLAEKHVHVAATTINKWCDGRKPIPLAALELLPEEFAVALVRRIFARRGMKP